MSTSSSVRRAAVGALSAAAGVALVFGTGVVGASAATATDGSTSSSTCTFGQHLRQAWGKVPADLKTALKAARALPAGADRRAALTKIRDSALSGGYGEATQVRAKWVADNRGGAKLRPLPDALKTDLKKLKGQSRADRIKGLESIATKAVDGGYGATVQSFAKAVKSSDAGTSCTAPKG